jgi:hypothetical protein
MQIGPFDRLGLSETAVAAFWYSEILGVSHSSGSLIHRWMWDAFCDWQSVARVHWEGPIKPV